MGLDITAYENIKLVKENSDREEAWEDDLFYAFVNPAFPDHCEDLQDSAAYSYEKEFGFRAGSYGGYSDWRNQLAKLAGYPEREYESGYRGTLSSHAAGAWEADGGPFWELINFSDCEGCIGSAVAKKLAADFAEYQELAEELHGSESDIYGLGGQSYFMEKYNEWRKACEMAANNGAISFH